MMESNFKDKVVLITGAASGFGAALAQRFATLGARLALSDLDEAALDKCLYGWCTPSVQVVTSRLDVSVEADHIAHMAQVQDRFGQLDIAINNAGMSDIMMPLTQIPVESFDRTMAVNTRGVFLGMKHQLPMMLAAGSGSIVNVASAAGLVGAGQLAAYAASKHAVVGLTRAAADEVARKNIRINAVCPAFAKTPLFNGMADHISAKTGMEREDAFTHIASRIPMRRVAEVSEIVQAIVWAADPANSFMTGQAIPIDGGLTAI